MVDPSPEPDSAGPPPETTADAAAGKTYLPKAGQRILAIGERWRSYEIEAVAPDGRANVYLATNVSQMEEVLISVTPLTKETAWRREVWIRLCQMPAVNPRALVFVEAIEEDGWRFEVTSRPPPMTLREWTDCNIGDAQMQQHFLEQLTAAVNALHAEGLVHLDIRPETIYIDHQDKQMEVALGGLDTVMLHNQPQPEVVKINPFYAPPEAMDPGALATGVALRAWDWWGVGRVMQELVLGRHVMSVVFGTDVIREPTPELHARAEALLWEREPPGLRAGAVEAMGVTNSRLKSLFRGLLTSARDGRWSGEAVERWLSQEKVSDRYDLSKDARIFNWQGRGFTLPEAVAFFGKDKNWEAGEETLAEPDNPASLAHFLATEPRHKADWQKIEDIHRQVESREWNEIPLAARRTITTAAAWFMLGPQPGMLLFRGRRIDLAKLDEWLSHRSDPGNLVLVRALLSPPCIALIRPLDGSSAEVLEQVAAVGVEALRQAEQARWVAPGDTAAQSRVLRLALKPVSSICTQADKVRAAYATCGDPALAKMLADPHAEPWANVLLVVTAEDPARFGYVTKEEYSRKHLAVEEAKCRQLRATVFWWRAGRLLRAGMACTGEWREFLILVVGIAGLGLGVARDVVTTAGLLTLVMAGRFLLFWYLQSLVRRWDPSAAPWRWQDGPARCLTELKRVAPSDGPATEAELVRRLAEAEAKRSALLPEGKRELPAAPPRLTVLWVGLAGFAVLVVMGSIQLIRSYALVPDATEVDVLPTGEGPSSVAGPTLQAVPAQMDPFAQLLKVPGITPEIVAKLRSGEYEIVREGFGDTLHGPIVKWNWPIPAVIPPLPWGKRVVATPDQRGIARVSGELLLRPYGHRIVNALLLVRVPVPEGVGLMLFNARDHRLVDEDMFVLREELTVGTWYQSGRRKVLYLGVPEELEAEVLRAPR